MIHTMAGHSLRRRIRAYVALPHPSAILMVMLATALFGLLAGPGLPDPSAYALTLLAMLSGQIAIGALNEYCDRDLDAIGNPTKPIPAGLISPRMALWITLVSLAIMIVSAAPLGIVSLLLLCVCIGAGLAYDLWFKPTSLSWLPYLIALPLLPIWVWTTLARFDARLLLLYPLGALMVVAIHLAQSLSDAESDRAAGITSFIARLGRRRALIVCWCAAGLAAIEIGLAGALLGSRPLPAVVAGGLVLALLAATALLGRRSATLLDRHLFSVMGASAILLGAGWVLAIRV